MNQYFILIIINLHKPTIIY